MNWLSAISVALVSASLVVIVGAFAVQIAANVRAAVLRNRKPDPTDRAGC